MAANELIQAQLIQAQLIQAQQRAAAAQALVQSKRQAGIALDAAVRAQQDLKVI